jgi:hypothetical protein
VVSEMAKIARTKRCLSIGVRMLTSRPQSAFIRYELNARPPFVSAPVTWEELHEESTFTFSLRPHWSGSKK